MTDLWGGDEGELKKNSLLIEITDQWGGDVRELNKEKLHSLLIEIIDLWGVNKGELNKEKLHRLLVEITDLWGDDERELNKQNLHSLLFQLLNKDNYSKAGLWKDKQPKSNKEKLYTWLDNLKQYLCEAKHLFCVLFDTVLLYDSIKEGVERAKGKFRMILDLIRDKKLGEDSCLCYISDVVDMAHHAHFLIQLQDSDPFPFFFELLTHQALEHQTYYKWLGKEFKHIANGLQEIKVKVEKVGSNMAEAVMLSAIKSLDCWLVKKEESNLEKLYSLIVGMSDLGEEKKEMVHTLLLQFGMEKSKCERERKKEKLYKLLDLNNEKMYSLVVGMADFWEDYKGKLYRLLFQVGNQVDLKVKLYRLLHSFLVKITNWCRGDKRQLKKEKLHRLLVEITDLWGDDEGELNKENLHSLLFQMLNNDSHSEEMSGEVAGLWKDKQPKLNKEKLYNWLANKLDLYGAKYLFSVLLDIVLLYNSSSYFHEASREGVEGAKRGFRIILDLVTDKKLEEESSLRYFISSDVVDMAHHARFLIQLQDSDPFALYFELSEYQALEHQTYYKWFSKEFKHIANGLQEITVKLEKVGRTMVEVVILSAIESMDCWLLKKEESNLEKLYSLIVGMSDLGEENKEMVHTLLLQFEMMIENEYVEYEKERKKVELYNLLDLKEEKMKSLVVGMADFWVDDKGKLYYLMFLVDTYYRWRCDKGAELCRLLIEMTDLWGGDEGELKKKKLHSLLIGITDQWGGWYVRELNKEKLHSLLIEIIDLWGGNKGGLNKEKLHRLLVEITDLWGDGERELIKKNLHSFLLQMLNKDNYSKARLGKDKQPESNKEKLYTWLNNKLDLCGAKHLFCVLLDTVLLYNSIKEGVEGAKKEFRKILDLVTDKKLVVESSLRYFISDVVDIAHHAHFLIQLEDSDHFPLFFELLTHQALEHQTYYKWLGKEFKHIANGLQEIQVKVEKAGSNMTEPVILWAIKSLECWLRKKGGLAEENLEKLYSLIVGMSDFGEQKKKMVYSLLLHFGKETFEYERERNLRNLSYLPVGLSDLGEEETEMLHSLQQLAGSRFRMVETVHIFYNLLDMNKKKMYSLVVGMADFWEDNNDKLYTLLFLVAVLWQDYEGKFYSVLFDKRAYWLELDRDKLQSFLVEITDLWGDDEGELDKEKLHRLLFQMLNNINYMKRKMVRSMSGEVAGLWKDKQPKLKKEKLYTWLANKMDLGEPEKLFGVLLYTSSHVHKEIREGVEVAKREFRMILDLIRDKKLEEERSLRYSISDVVDMAHHAHFLIQLQDSDPFALFFKFKVYSQELEHLTYNKWFGDKFKHIVNGLQEIKDSMLGSRVERLQNVREMTGDENVVGLKEDVKSLLLCDSYITVIKGMAGIGKTTLARQVYNHTTIAQQFQHRAWVCLSKFFSRKETLVSLIRQVVDSNKLASLEKIECVDYKSLKQVLRQQLLEKRYFIVLEDVWDNTTHLQYVMKALPKEKGSRLLLTTRKGSGLSLLTLTYYYYNRVHYHKMKSMDADESWRLLLKTLSIEGSDEEFPKPLVAMARKILRKCGGLPLAIKEVGRNWATERQSGREWEKVIESIDLSETLRALESSYDDWDPKLKSYFLHLAFFKEGATIRVKRLLHIWKVMGVLLRWEQFQSGLTELLDEYVIDASDVGYAKGYIPNIKTYSIHAIFHMLSIRKAEDELNFEILNKDGNHRPSHEPHHRVIYCSREKLMNCSSNQDEHLVSLFLYGGGYFNASDPSYWNHFKQLKTLDMEDFGLKILPDVFDMLSELRYLGLRNNYIQEIPHSLSRLKKLEVLDIALNFMVEVEDIIWEKMVSLRHLYMSDISCRKPLRIDKLKNLETWTYVSVHNWTYDQASRLEMMMSLTKLGIQEVDENTNVSKLFASLAMLKRLDFLILKGFRFKSMPSLDDIGILQNLRELKLEGLITRLPSANNFPPKIGNLSLVNSCLREDLMPILEKLSNLTYLKLQNAYTGQQMVISHNGFSKLRILVIKELWHLKNVQIEKSAMKWLEDLEINNCPNLETLPEDYIPSSRIMFKMKTSKKNATKIRESSFVSRIRKVDIQP